MEPTVICFEIPGKPIGKAHTVKSGSRKITLTTRTRGYMKFVRTLARLRAPRKPWPGAISVTIVYYLVPPPSWSTVRRMRALSGEEHCTKYPDGDNVSKSICDAMNKVIYIDDRMIVDYAIKKRWGREEKTIVTVERLG